MQQREDVRCARARSSCSRRRRAPHRSTASRWSSARPIAPVGRSRLGRRSENSIIASGCTGASSPPIACLSGPIRSASTPNTARRITSRVIRACAPAGASARPSGQLGHVPPRRLHDHVLVLAHALAVEGRQKELALAHVLGPRQHDHRARPHHRRDRRVARRRGSHLRRRREHRLDRLRVRDHHEFHPAGGERQRERLAEPFRTAVHHPRRRNRPGQRLQRSPAPAVPAAALGAGARAARPARPSRAVPPHAAGAVVAMPYTLPPSAQRDQARERATRPVRRFTHARRAPVAAAPAPARVPPR